MNKLLFLVSLPMLLLIASCSSDGAFSVEDGLIDVKSNLTVIDSCSLHTYTVKSDSIVESASEKLLVGRYYDGVLGTINASSYFEVGYSSSLSVDVAAVYDSVSLILNNTNYYYGDTTKVFTLEVHRLLQNLSDNPNVNNKSPNLAGYRYNTSTVLYDANSLGQTSYYPRPNRNKALHIKLSDDFGADLFKSILLKNDLAYDMNKFLRYFKGIALTTDNSTLSSSIQRFSTADSSLYIRMYYHVNDVANTINFQMVNNSSSRPYELPFNHVMADYMNAKNGYLDSKLDSLKSLQDKISSVQTDNEFYCQPGVGVMSRIELPYLRNLLLTNGNIKIMKAQLILCPARSSYKLINLPTRLALYEANDVNEVGSLVNDTTVAQLTIDKDYNETTSYTIDVTSYVASVLTNKTDDMPTLIVTQPAGKNATTVDRVIFTNGIGKTNSTRLKIMYWKY